MGNVHMGSVFIHDLGTRASDGGGAACRKCTRFLLVSPEGVSTMYDLGEGIAVTRPYSQGPDLWWGEGLA